MALAPKMEGGLTRPPASAIIVLGLHSVVVSLLASTFFLLFLLALLALALFLLAGILTLLVLLAGLVRVRHFKLHVCSVQYIDVGSSVWFQCITGIKTGRDVQATGLCPKA